jgi:hypothetical protein
MLLSTSCPQPPGPIRAKTTNDEVMPGDLPTRWHDSHAGYT